MRSFGLALLVVIASAVPRAAHAQTWPGDPSVLFSHQASVVSEEGVAYRLPLPVEVLSHCRPDLSDLRLYGSGIEIPWMIDSATRLAGASEAPRSIAVPILETRAHDVEGPPRTPSAFHEVYEIPGPGEAPSRAAWDLELGTVRAPFVAEVHVSAIDRDGLARELGTGSVFRFVAPLRERLRVPIEGGPSEVVRVEVRVREGFLDPTMRWVATRRARMGTEMVVPLTIASQHHQGGQTILEVTRPEGITPEQLRFETTTPALYRAVRVTAGERSVEGAIWRMPGEASLSSLEVRGLPVRTPTIQIRIDDGDSPPLEGLTVAAVLSQPVLVYFTAADTLRFGGGRVRAPHYDLVALEGSWAVDQLLDGTTMPVEASVGTVAPSPGWAEGPALAALQRPGVVVPPGAHAFAAPLEVTHAQEGASRFVLDAAVLAAAREDLADLRIVDAEGRQWPYLFRDTAPLHEALEVGAPTREGAITRYALTARASRFIATALVIDPEAELVSRPARVQGVDARGDAISLGETTLVRTPGQAQGPLFVSLGETTRTSAIALEVTDGSEAPLALRSAALEVPTREVVLVAPPGSYRVLVGDEASAPPTYEIESVRGLLEAIPIDDAVLGALAPEPHFHAPTFWEQNGGRTMALWGVLVLAVLVLGALTWRVSRAPTDEVPPTPSETPPSETPPSETPPSETPPNGAA